MLQKELAKRLKARYDTKMDGNGWLEEKPMTYINEKHRARFTLAAKNISKTNYALLSALYLLTADQRLWGCCKHHIYRRRASAEKVYHRYIAVQKKKQ